MVNAKRLILASLIAAAVALLPVTPALASLEGARPECPPDEITLFAGGGTNLSNGAFFPGTAVYEDKRYLGVPHTIPMGCNVRFVNLDPAVVTNSHQIMSFKRRKGRPLFMSPDVLGPGTAKMRTNHLRPGIYPYFCTVHFGMLGLLGVERIETP